MLEMLHVGGLLSRRSELHDVLACFFFLFKFFFRSFIFVSTAFLFA